MDDSIKPLHDIRDEEHLALALARIDEIFFAVRGTPEGEELDCLVDAVIRFENAHYPMEVSRSGFSTRDFRLEMALLPPHLRQAACLAAGCDYDMDWSGWDAAEGAFSTAFDHGRLGKLEEAVRALSDFCGLETVRYDEDDLETAYGFPWFVGSLFEGDRPLPIEDQPSGREGSPSADAEALASRMMRRSDVHREQGLDWIHKHVISAYGMTAAQIMAKHGLGEMLDFFDALEAGVHQ